MEKKKLAHKQHEIQNTRT